MISPESFTPCDHEAVVVPTGAGVVVKPSKSNVKQKCCAVYVGTGGAVVLSLIAPDGTVTAQVYKNVASGQVLRGQVASVGSTADGTTATDMVFQYLGL